MKKLMSLLYLVWISTNGTSQTVIVNDNFLDRSKFIDNTLLTTWGGNAGPTTGIQIANKTDNFGLTFASASLTSSALSNSGYTSATSLKTLTAFDYEFPSRLDRSTTQINIEFDAIWSALDGSGESGRLVVTLVDEYPNGGALFGQVDNLSLQDPFGKPIYNIRLRNKSGGGKNSLMLYGAGTSTNPEWEKYSAGPWWLPGFSVQSGGGSPGSGTDYPVTGTICSYVSMASATKWKHFTWVIKPERMEVFQRNSDEPPSSNTLAFFMEIPKTTDPAVALNRINTAHGTSASVLPPYYAWFGHAEAVRFYFRGAPVNTWIANVSISSQPTLLLALKLSGFSAKLGSEMERKLNWVIEDVEQAREFTIEESLDGTTFRSVSTMEATASRAYNFVHKSPEKTIYYRLHVVGRNGNSFYSKVLKSEIQDAVNGSVRLFPNPATDVLHIDLPPSYTDPVLMRLYDVSGKLVQTGVVKNKQPIQLSRSLQGLVFIELSYNGKTILSEQIEISRK